MQENSPDRADSPVTQGKPYTPAECARIEVLARGSVTASEIEALFPDRTVAAVKKQIVVVRHRLGLVVERENACRGDGKGTMLDPADAGILDLDWPRYARDMRQGSAALLNALMAA